MFRKIWNWLFGKKKSEDGFVSPVIYRPKERIIFGYFDGRGDILVDPMEIYKKLMDVGPELQIELKVMDSPSKGARSAHDGVVNKIRDIFNVKPLSEGGLTQEECVNLLDEFFYFCDSIKKNSRTIQTSAKETSDSTGSISEGSQPTSNTSDSGSTNGGASTATPTLPTSAPGSPSGQ